MSYASSDRVRPTLNYDPSLDGLRAIAVVSVMVYHGYLGVAGGGFLGVDLFFVLSGYLITTLLLLEYDATGTISLSAFWLRRAKRLLPVMFVVVGVVMLIGALTAGPDALKAIRNDGIATIFYSANWRQAFSEQSYFDQFADPSPFRHMWS
ncbi:MAG: acyltransferase family protein, partial [Acidimicrobiales bacterium]